MYISLLTALTFAGAREDLTRVEIDTLTSLSTWSGTPQIDANVKQIAARAHYSDDATKKALASLENKNLIVRIQRFENNERISSLIYVDWKSALSDKYQDDYDRLAAAGAGAYNFPASRENNPHLWGDDTTEAHPEPHAAPTDRPSKAIKTVRKTAITEDWAPTPSTLAKTRTTYPSMPYEEEREKFINYYLGRGEKRVNWDATWRTWCLNGNRYANNAWKTVTINALNSPPAAINSNTGKPLTRDDFGYACLAAGIDPNRYINYWKPYMGLPSDPGWPEWAAKIDKHCGRA